MRKALLLFMLLPLCLYTQNITLSGTITDESSGEALIGANIYITSLEKGTVTNNYGFYSITIPKMDSIGLAVTYVGFTPQFKKIYLEKNLLLNFELEPRSSDLGEVIVRADRQNENVARAQMGVLDIPTSKIKELPAILGEADVLKVVQLLPGVQSGNEGTTGFFVRGGNADQNLVQLDEAVVYNPNHLFGLFSTFNTRAINNVTLIKGGFPAQYGGRLSSILDITMKEGNKKEFAGEGGIGLISSQLTLEGPLKKEKASFIISGRRTYYDLVIKPFLPKKISSTYHFYDLNAKLNWQIGDNDRLFFSAFKGKDDAVYKETGGIRYDILFGNSTATLRWNHLFGQKLFLNTSFIVNEYNQNIATIQDNASSQVFSTIRDLNGKMEFQYFPGLNHSLRMGAHFLNHQFQSSGKSQTISGPNPVPDLNKNAVQVKYFNELAFYLNDEFEIGNGVSASLGLRAPAFVAKGVNYFKLEPRATLKVPVHQGASVKGAYTIMNQFLHLVPSSTASVPSEIWIPSTKQTKPQISEQFSLGYFQNFKNNNLESSLEFYYKTMENQVLFREGNQLIENLDVDDLLVYGKGWSYGAEFFLRKNSGKFTGWLSYTLSWTYQQFDDLNFGEKFPFRFDRRNDLSLVGTYSLSNKWSISGVFIYSTGTVYTVPVGRLSVVHGGSLFEGNYFVYENRNNTRLGDYHRLDISATCKQKSKIFKKEYQSEWVFGVYNIYSRLNPYFVYFQVDPRTDQPKARQVSLLPIMPSVTYNFKF